MLSHKKEFSRFAKEYITTNDLQKNVAKHLLSMSDNEYKHILDLGCGGGEVYNNISWNFTTLLAVDSSLNMCSLHPKSSKVTVIQGDFDDNNFFISLQNQKPFDIIISSSALHWSKDIQNLIKNMSKISNNILISLFTNNTMKDLHNTLNVNSPLYSESKIINSIKPYFNIKSIETKQYSKTFISSKELFKYIKHTGISGGIKVANISEVLKCIKNDIIKELKFEVIYIKARSLN
jgi:malonyl-CoA O-methyltransferase